MVYFGGIGTVGSDGDYIGYQFFLLFIGGAVYAHSPAELSQSMYAAGIKFFCKTF